MTQDDEPTIRNYLKSWAESQRGSDTERLLLERLSRQDFVKARRDRRHPTLFAALGVALGIAASGGLGTLVLLNHSPHNVTNAGRPPVGGNTPSASNGAVLASPSPAGASQCSVLAADHQVSMEFDQSKANGIVAATAMGSTGARSVIAVSQDAGLTWGRETLIDYGVSGVAMVDADHGFVASSGGVLATSDGGKTWRTVNHGGALCRLTFFTDTRGLAVSGHQLVVTSDGGQTFAPAGVGSSVGDVRAVDSQHAWAAGSDGIYATADGGSTWRLQTSLPASALSSVTPAIAVADQQTAAVFYHSGTVSGQEVGALFLTQDAGSTWQYVADDAFDPLAIGRTPKTTQLIPSLSASAAVLASGEIVLVGSQRDATGDSVTAVCRGPRAAGSWDCVQLSPSRTDLAGDVAVLGPGRLVAAVLQINGSLTVFGSMDGGVHWAGITTASTG